MDWLDFALRLACAVFAGALIGFERQWRNRMAGLRTNCLVSAGAGIFVLLPAMTSVDTSPTRVAAQVVSGVGFLGAGVILRDGFNVRGINTAATLWCAAAVGVLAGSGLLLQSLAAAGIVLIVNLVLRPIGRRIDRQPANQDTESGTIYGFQATCRRENEAHVRALLLQAVTGDECQLRALESEDLNGTDKVEVHAEFVTPTKNDLRVEAAAGRLSLEPSVSAVRWEVIDSE